VLERCEDLGHVLALELYTAAQALDYRRDMLNAARDLARRGGAAALAAKVAGAPEAGRTGREQFDGEVAALCAALAAAGEFHPGERVARAHARIRREIAFQSRDRAMDADVRRVTALVASGALDAIAARGATGAGAID
jgi:histidine ammonia-lyase